MHNYSHLFRKCTLAGLAIAAILTSARPLSAQVDLGLSPMRVDFPVVPGKSFSGTLVLTNSGTAKSRVRAELLDLYVDETTTPQFVASAPGEAQFSCRSWLSVNPMELEVDPRSKALVRYSVRAPASANERGYHCALGFRTLPAPDETAGTALHTAVRLITVLYPTVGKPAITGVIKDLKLEGVPGRDGTSWRAVVIMENSGLILYRPAGALELVDSTGKVIESQRLSSFPVLPQRQQRFLMPLKSVLSPGQYTIRARIDVGSEIQEASVVVTAEMPAPDQSSVTTQAAEK